MNESSHENGTQTIIDNGDRTQWMIRWLLDNRDRINNLKKGQVVFDLAGPSLYGMIRSGPEEIVKQKI